MSAPEIVGERLHLLLCTADGSLCGHGCKVSSLRAGLVLFLWFPHPAVSHQKAVTARRYSVLAAAARAEDAGCRDAYDGASSPENRNCCLPGTHRARGRRMPADRERNRKVAGACCGKTAEVLLREMPAEEGCTYSGLGSSKAPARSAARQQKRHLLGGSHGSRAHRKRK